MVKFSELFVYILIVASLGGISLGTISLLVMLVKDIKSKKLW